MSLSNEDIEKKINQMFVNPSNKITVSPVPRQDGDIFISFPNEQMAKAFAREAAKHGILSPSGKPKTPFDNPKDISRSDVLLTTKSFDMDNLPKFLETVKKIDITPEKNLFTEQVQDKFRRYEATSRKKDTETKNDKKDDIEMHTNNLIKKYGEEKFYLNPNMQNKVLDLLDKTITENRKQALPREKVLAKISSVFIDASKQETMNNIIKENPETIKGLNSSELGGNAKGMNTKSQNQSNQR